MTDSTAHSATEAALAAEIADLLAEWRKTCRLTGIRHTDRDAAAFVASALAWRLGDPQTPSPAPGTAMPAEPAAPSALPVSGVDDAAKASAGEGQPPSRAPHAPERATEVLAQRLYADAHLGPGYMLLDDCQHLAARVMVALEATEHVEWSTRIRRDHKSYFTREAAEQHARRDGSALVTRTVTTIPDMITEWAEPSDVTVADQTRIADLIREAIRARGNDASLEEILAEVIGWPPVHLVSRTSNAMLATGEITLDQDRRLHLNTPPYDQDEAAR